MIAAIPGTDNLTPRAGRPAGLVGAAQVRWYLGVSSEALEEMVDEGGLVYCFNIATGQRLKQNLRFWWPEVADHPDAGKASLEGVISSLIGTQRPRLATREVVGLLGTDRPTLWSLMHDGQITGPMEGGLQYVSRASLAEFLRRVWVGAVKSSNGRGGKGL